MAAAPTTAEPLWQLVEESLEEAAFYWKRWEADLRSPTRNLDEVWSWAEDRLQGALDGVRVAGQGIMRATETALCDGDKWTLAVTAHVLAAQSPAVAREALAAAIREASGPKLWSMIRGIEVADLDGSFAPVTRALTAGGPEHGATLCRLKAFRRSAPGRELAQAFESGVPSLQVEALRALRHATDERFLTYAAAGFKSDQPVVRAAAIEFGLWRRQPEAWDAALNLARERRPESAPFLPLLAAVGSPEEQQVVISALREPALQVAGLYALAHVGTPEAVEICLHGMRDAKLARSAGEAYGAITGANLTRDHLAAPEPPDSPVPSFESDVLDADLVPQGIELWPQPDSDAVRQHWQGIKAHYRPGVRYFGGRAADMSVLLEAVEGGPMLRRGDLALELGVRTGGKYDVEPRAFAGAQRRMMAHARMKIAPQAQR